MNKKVLTLLGSVALLLVIGTLSTAIVFAGHSGSTTKGTVTVPDVAKASGEQFLDSSDGLTSVQTKQGIKHSVARVVSKSDPQQKWGQSHLWRSEDGVEFILETSGLGDQSAYTIWILVDEEVCCAKVFEIALRIDGGVSAPDGTATFSGFLPAGTLPAVDGAAPKNVLRTGTDGTFDDPMGAVIALDVRSHGAATPNDTFDQINFLNGFCNSTCVSIQKSTHNP